jgi:hypothetical protein
MVKRSIFRHADFLDPCDGLHSEASKCCPPQDEHLFLASFSYLMLTYPRLPDTNTVFLRIIKVRALEGRKAGEASLSAWNGSGSA